MQPYTLSWLHVNQDKGNLGVSIEVSFKLGGVPIVLKFVPVYNGVAHMCLLY
jgi:hypothetical protein